MKTEIGKINKNNIDSVIMLGESERVGFKRRVPDKRTLGRCISALSNTGGGILIIGYDENSRNWVGVADSDVVNLNRWTWI